MVELPTRTVDRSLARSSCSQGTASLPGALPGADIVMIADASSWRLIFYTLLLLLLPKRPNNLPCIFRYHAPKAALKAPHQLEEENSQTHACGVVGFSLSLSFRTDFLFFFSFPIPSSLPKLTSNFASFQPPALLFATNLPTGIGNMLSPVTGRSTNGGWHTRNQRWSRR